MSDYNYLVGAKIGVDGHDTYKYSKLYTRTGLQNKLMELVDSHPGADYLFIQVHPVEVPDWDEVYGLYGMMG